MRAKKSLLQSLLCSNVCRHGNLKQRKLRRVITQSFRNSLHNKMWHYSSFLAVNIWKVIYAVTAVLKLFEQHRQFCLKSKQQQILNVFAESFIETQEYTIDVLLVLDDQTATDIYKCLLVSELTVHQRPHYRNASTVLKQTSCKTRFH